MRRPVVQGLLLAALAALALVAASGCKNEATRHCHDRMTQAQEIVKNVDSKDLASVKESLAAVEGAQAACTKAGRSSEVESLMAARNQLTGHAAYLEKRATFKQEKALTPAELERLVKEGDPKCPKGQAYRPKDLEKEIRCTGPQPADMTRKRAEEYFTERGYTVRKSDSPPTLRAELGGELFVFTHRGTGDGAEPRCLTVYPPPGMSWQEAAARVTGVPPQKLDKEPTSVRTGRGALTMKVTDTEKKVTVEIGDCG
jgi:hypothetical protein